jgi:hypothetical protein
MDDAPEIWVAYSAPSERCYRLARLTQTIWLVVSSVELLLGLRALLKLLPAEPQAPLPRIIYGVTDMLLLPLTRLAPAAAPDRSGLDSVALMGMLAYVLLAWGVVLLAWSPVAPSSEC